MRGLLVLMLVASAAATAHADARDFTGSSACGSCHPREYAAWRETPHAKTAARFVANAANGSGSESPPQRCLGCHGTGEAPAGQAIAVEVGCEACHGAGAAYAPDDVMRDAPLARALGLADLSTPTARAALCIGCHARPTTSRSFDPTAPVHALTTTSTSAGAAP